MRFKNRSEAALYVWDYFYVANVPGPGDEKVWRTIERATCRIREAETELDPPTPPDVRLRSARRFRNSVRVAQRHIKRLSVEPERWVVDELGEMEKLADELIRTLDDSGRQVVLH